MRLTRRFLTALVLTPALVFAGPAPAEEGQVFMLEIGAHVAPIPRIAVSEAHGMALTGASDRTLRYWDLETGEPWAVRRPPMGEGRAGQVTATAILPSGMALFAAQAPEGEAGSTAIHAMDARTGRILFRSASYPGTAELLSFRADGGYLAVAAGLNGLWLLNAGMQMLWTIEPEGARVTWAEFGAKGLLTWTTDKGEVEVGAVSADGGDYARVGGARVEAGLVPASAALSPDAREVAVGYADAAFVDVFAVETGRLLERLSAGNVVQGGGDLSRVAWSPAPDGAKGGRLYAAGTLQAADGRNAVVVWKGAKGPGFALPVARDSISQLAAMSDGGVVFASTFPSWGRLEALDAQRPGEPLVRLLHASEAPKLDMRYASGDGRFAVSDDGARVWLKPNPEQGGGSDRALVFDLDRGLLDAAPRDGDLAALHAPARSRPGAEVDGLMSLAPTVNGRGLPEGVDGPLFGAGERALSADVAADGSRALIGADYSLTLLGADGRLIAHRALHAPAWAVALAPSGDVAAAALGDGTVRWYAVSGPDLLGEIAAVFVKADRREWVAWRNDGRFIHSSFGGSELGGYASNRVRRTAEGRLVDLASDWRTMSEAYHLLYDSDAVKGVLGRPESWPAIVARDGLGETLARDRWPEPAATAICPADDRGRDRCVDLAATEVGPGRPRVLDWQAEYNILIDLVADPEGAAPAKVILYRNGAAAGVFEGAELTETAAEDAEGRPAHRLPLDLVAGENRVEARVFGADGLFVQLPVATLTLPEDATPAVLHVLAVGVSRYASPDLKLDAAAGDAQAVAAKLAADYADVYAEARISPVLLDEFATRDSIVLALDAIAEQADGNDAVILYFAGHGETGKLGYAFLGYEVTSVSLMYDLGIDSRRLMNAIAAMKAGSVLVMLDTCYADAVDIDMLSALAHDLQVYFLMASAATERARDMSRDGRNGVFMAGLLSGLDGAAALQRDEVDALALGAFLTDPRLHDGRGQEVIFRNGASSRLRPFPLTHVQ